MLEGVRFEDKEKASAFFDSVKGKQNEFAKLAEKADGGEFKDFGRVSKEPAKGGFAMSDVPSQVKDKALSLKKFPAVEKIDAGKNVWVIRASDKKETEYFNLDEIKPQLEVMLKNNKFREEIEKQVKDLRKDFTIDVNEDFFKEAKTEDSEEKSPVAAA